MALDYGTRRIGLAISDAEGTFAFPAGALNSQGRARDLEELGRLVAERGVQRIVVGLPIHMSGRKGETAEAAEKFANEVAKKNRAAGRNARRTLEHARGRAIAE